VNSHQIERDQLLRDEDRENRDAALQRETPRLGGTSGQRCYRWRGFGNSIQQELQAGPDTRPMEIHTCQH